MSDNLTLKLSALQRILKFDISNCWEVDLIKKNISLIADSKSYVDYLRIVSIIFKNSLYSNNLSNIECVREITTNLSNLMTIKHICDKVISNVNITFRDDSLTQGTGKSFQIYEQDPVYLTSRIKATPTEIIYASKNESIIRRLVLHTLYNKLPTYFTDPVTIIEKSKNRAFTDTGDETKTRKVNYYYETTVKSKYRNRRKKGGDREDKKPKMEVLSPIRFTPCPKLLELLLVMRRNCLVVTSKIDILRGYKSLRSDLTNFQSWFTPLVKNVMPEFSLENLNEYFWKAVCNKEIEHNFLTKHEICKSLTEAINDFQTEDRSKSDSFNEYFPNFFSEEMLIFQGGENSSQAANSQDSQLI